MKNTPISTQNSPFPQFFSRIATYYINYLLSKIEGEITDYGYECLHGQAVDAVDEMIGDFIYWLKLAPRKVYKVTKIR